MPKVPDETLSDAERCLASAIRILKYRFNSVVELRRKLASKGYERESIDRTVGILTSEGWLNDDRFAGALVRTRKLKNFGPQRMLAELRSTGVSDDVASRAVRENLDAESEQSSAVALCEKKMRIIARRYGPEYLRTSVGRKKLAAYLLNHGYEAGRVFTVIDECMKRFGEERGAGSE